MNKSLQEYQEIVVPTPPNRSDCFRIASRSSVNFACRFATTCDDFIDFEYFNKNLHTWIKFFQISMWELDYLEFYSTILKSSRPGLCNGTRDIMNGLLGLENELIEDYNKNRYLPSLWNCIGGFSLKLHFLKCIKKTLIFVSYLLNLQRPCALFHVPLLWGLLTAFFGLQSTFLDHRKRFGSKIQFSLREIFIRTRDFRNFSRFFWNRLLSQLHSIFYIFLNFKL